MNPLVGILGGLGAAFGWGTADFFAAVASDKHGPFKTAFLSQLFGLCLVGILVLTGHIPVVTDIKILGLAAALGFGFSMGLAAFYKALEIGPVMITSPVGNSYPAVTVFIALFFLGEKLLPLQLFAIAVIILGIILASVERGTKTDSRKGLFFAFASTLIWGCSFAFVGVLINQVGWLAATFYEYLFASIWLGILVLATSPRPRHVFENSLDRSIIAVTLLQLFGTVIFYLGRAHSLSAIITPVSSVLPLFTISLAALVLKERVKRIQLVGAVVIIAGLVILSLKLGT